MGDRLPDGLGGRGHWVDMLGGYKGEVNQSQPKVVGYFENLTTCLSLLHSKQSPFPLRKLPVFPNAKVTCWAC
jgi:hypothetical protein